jgi:hypothetical protein
VVERGWGLDVITCQPPMSADSWRWQGVRVFGVPPVTLPIERLESLASAAYRTLRRRTRRVVEVEDGIGRVSGPDRHRARPELIDRSEIRWRLHPPRDLLRAYWACLEYARYRGWAHRAASLGLRLVEPGVHLALVTSGPPHMTHDAGRAMSRRTGLPFVMDMRDPWSLSQKVHESVASPLWFRLARRYEHAAVQQAALIVANTDAAREALAAAYPSAVARLITVMNGSDDDPIPRSTAGHRFTIAYAGTIYLTQHSQMLFRAAARVIRELRLTPEDFAIDFTGGEVSGQASLLEMAREEGMAGFLSTRPACPHPEVLKILAGATMLVTFPGWDTITIPAKIFECVRFDAWLLALCEPGSATDRLLKGVQADVVRPDDITAIATAIKRRYVEYRAGVRPVRAVSDDRFSRRTQARILLDAIDRLDPARHDGGHRTESSSAHDAR